MRQDSELFKVLSPEVIPAIDLGQLLSIHNNSHHPVLNQHGIYTFASASEYLKQVLPSLLQTANDLKQLPIRTNEWFLALNYLNSYIYILEATLEMPDNLRLHNYHLAKNGGAK